MSSLLLILEIVAIVIQYLLPTCTQLATAKLTTQDRMSPGWSRIPYNYLVWRLYAILLTHTNLCHRITTSAILWTNIFVRSPSPDLSHELIEVFASLTPSLAKLGGLEHKFSKPNRRMVFLDTRETHSLALSWRKCTLCSFTILVPFAAMLISHVLIAASIGAQ